MAFRRRDRRQRAWWHLTSTGPPYVSHPQTSSTNSNSRSALYKSHGTKTGRLELQRPQNTQNRPSSPQKAIIAKQFEAAVIKDWAVEDSAKRPEGNDSGHNRSR